MKTELDIDQLQQKKSEIEQLLEQQTRKLNFKFEQELEQQFWYERETQLIKMLQRAYIPILVVFFIFMCISLTLNYFSADDLHRTHDFSRNFISFSASWIMLIVLFIMAKKEEWNYLYMPVNAFSIGFALTVNLCVQLTMLSLPVIWRGTIVTALAIIFLYLCSGLRPKVAFYTSMLSALVTWIFLKIVSAEVPSWVVVNTLLLPNLVGLALALLSISTERIRFLQSIIIEYDKQIYSRLNQHFIHLSHQDSLTLLGNRRGFEQNLSYAIEHSQATAQHFAILFIDVDYFKRYNDRYGHDQGDQALVRVAQTLLRHIQEQDIAIRFGGEEFVLLLKNTEQVQANQVAENILKDIRTQNIEHCASQIADHLTVSIGLTMYQGEPNITYHDILKMADQALYEAKAQGRDRVQVFNLSEQTSSVTA